MVPLLMSSSNHPELPVISGEITCVFGVRLQLFMSFQLAPLTHRHNISFLVHGIFTLEK